jgi:acyl-homoserine lactone acylase PvdQ
MAGFTLQQLEKLEEAISTGALEVWFGDKRVRYDSIDSMMKLRERMKQELGLSDPSKRRVLATFNKGLNNETT